MEYTHTKQNIWKVRTIVFLGIVMLLLTGIAEVPGLQNIKVEAATKRVESVSLNYNTYLLQPNKSITLKAGCLPKSAKNKKVSWKSSKKSVATVSSKGKVTAKKTGTARITAVTRDGSKKSVSCTIKVVKKITKVSSIKITGRSKKMTVGEKLQLKTSISPKKATLKTLYWKSSNTSVAIVSQKGSVKALKAGNVRITAMAQDGSKRTRTYNITVSKPQPAPVEDPAENPVIKATGISLSKSSAEVYEGKAFDLSATVLPSNASNRSVQWYSDNSSVVSVSESGRVSGISVGTTNIYAKTMDGTNLTAACAVTVKPSVTDASASIGDGYIMYRLDRNAEKFRLVNSKPGFAQATETKATELSNALWSYTVSIRNGINSNQQFYNFLKNFEGNSLLNMFGIKSFKVVSHSVDYSSLRVEVGDSGRKKTATINNIQTLEKVAVKDMNGISTTSSRIRFQAGSSQETFQLNLYTNGSRIALYRPNNTMDVEVCDFYLDNEKYQYVFKIDEYINAMAVGMIPSFPDFRYIKMYNIY